MPWSVPIANYMIKHPEKYSEEKRYKWALMIINSMRRRSFTKTKVYGKENIPNKENQSGGTIFYANHQGKYDALGILLAMEKPCSVLWGKISAEKFVARQVCQLVDGVVIDLDDMKDKVTSILKVIEKVKTGKNMLIFPEGGYEEDTHNNLQEFKAGCFSCSLKTKTPIVPIAIYDSYKAMNGNSFWPATTEIHFLEPIYYEEYGELKKNELAELVKSRIQEKMDEIKNKRKMN